MWRNERFLCGIMVTIVAAIFLYVLLPSLVSEIDRCSAQSIVLLSVLGTILQYAALDTETNTLLF